MILVKVTIVLAAVIVFMWCALLVWSKTHPLEVLMQDYPWWAYIMVLLILVDAVCAFVSLIWYLFWYL